MIRDRTTELNNNKFITKIFSLSWNNGNIKIDSYKTRQL